jgi:membrane-bound lytic murein transglycosylase B
MIPDHRGRAVALVAVVAALAGSVALGLYAGSRPAPMLTARQQHVLVADPPAPGRGPSSARVAPVHGTGPLVSPAWVARTTARSGIPAPAVRAYGTATLRSAEEDRACHLGWTTLAGIGWVESHQGTIEGRVLEADGRPDRAITGVELDGSGRVAAVPDGSGGFQRALGPLQFIPSTWERWAADGDGDGVEDPQDVDDAALAAAHYLCSSGGDLATGTDWSAAVFSYNHSADYVRAVYAAARTYADRTS